MQMTAALHLVPEPDDEQPPTPDTSGEQQPAPEPAPAPAVEQEPGEELPDAEEPGEELHDDEDEEPAPRRALALPDLRPYADVTAVPQVLHAGVTATRRARAQRTEHRKGRPRRLLAIAVDVAAGSVLLLRHVPAWLGGEYGPKSVNGGGRFGLAALGGYFAYRTVDTWPLEGGAGLGLVWLAAALGERHRQRAQAAEQAKKKTKGKATAKDSPKTPEGAEEAAEEAAERAPARRSWWSRITSPGQPEQEPADTPDDEPDEAADDSPDEAAEEAAAEPPAPPSPETLARALHHLYRGGSGVLLTTLRQHLSLPHTRAVREVLGGAGIRVREGVRTPGGNGPGVHRADMPPPPPSPDPSPGDVVCAGQEPTTTTPTPGEGPQKGLRADGSYWPPGGTTTSSRTPPTPTER